MAATLALIAAFLFALAAALQQKGALNLPTVSVAQPRSLVRCYALAIAGVVGFVLQQVSLGTGRLSPSVATVSVANPIVGILIGTLLFDERLSRPAWHVVVAVIGLGLALAGAVAIALAREAAKREAPVAGTADASVARP